MDYSRTRLPWEECWSLESLAVRPRANSISHHHFLVEAGPQKLSSKHFLALWSLLGEPIKTWEPLLSFVVQSNFKMSDLWHIFRELLNLLPIGASSKIVIQSNDRGTVVANFINCEQHLGQDRFIMYSNSKSVIY